jgi:hypothetical protein
MQTDVSLPVFHGPSEFVSSGLSHDPLVQLNWPVPSQLQSFILPDVRCILSKACVSMTYPNIRVGIPGAGGFQPVSHLFGLRK